MLAARRPDFRHFLGPPLSEETLKDTQKGINAVDIQPTVLFVSVTSSVVAGNSVGYDSTRKKGQHLMYGEHQAADPAASGHTPSIRGA